MSPKFNKPGVRARATGPVTTTGATTTYEGGAAWTRDARSELVLLAVVNMVSEKTFYESAQDRDSRFARLCSQAAVEDGAWYLAFVTWLRGEANMRSASLVAAAVGVKARLAENERLSKIAGPVSVVLDESEGFNRKIVAAVLQRPDEPGEFLAYWHTQYGKNLPMPVKRGLGDAARRLYSERSLLKYDTESHAVRFGDVVDLVHPVPGAPWQSDLFEYAMHRRHGYAEQVPESLSMVHANRSLRSNTDALNAGTRGWLDADTLKAAGMTWEDVLSALGSKVDKAKLWEAMIPSMGIMALLRNLRNFDEAGVSDKAAQLVINKLSDPEVIARSRQFPYRFLSAYRAAPSLRWSYPLERALDASLANVPRFRGRSLVLVDTSGSMMGTVSDKSTVRHVDVGALVGVTLAARSEGPVDLVQFATTWAPVHLPKGTSVLKGVESLHQKINSVGWGTNTAQALAASYAGHDRVVVVTDGQAFMPWGGGSVSGAVPANVPLFGIDTTGYSASSIDTSKPHRYEVGGFSDKLFTMISLLDEGRSTSWPWEA
jgi:hypothetical protein